jgi:leucyl aminopeptidase
LESDMSHSPIITFANPITHPTGLVSIFQTGDGKHTHNAQNYAGSSLSKAISASDFKAKIHTTLDILVPESTQIECLSVIGVGNQNDLNENSWLKLGGTAGSKLAHYKTATMLLEVDNYDVTPQHAADFALGILLRSYKFDKYKTKKEDDTSPKEPQHITICVNDPIAAEHEYTNRQSVYQGVELARDLVNEPANILGTLEFTQKAKDLSRLGVEIEILTEKEMKDLGMGALLGVAQGSHRPPRLVIMRWNGAVNDKKPIAFVGKGVVFDSGGISIKPAAGMEDMKGDMGGAAAVTGLMHVLASRKAKVNVIGIIGLVENMVDANAQRPGDIVTAMSGTTIEVLNTDAEGRLVLADALHYCNTRFEPELMVNLATLTGAILVALGTQHAGLFSNNDELSRQLTTAGLKTGELLWRMPMGAEYDKLIDSTNADVKNIGGRFAGSITAAQFLQRFVGETKWAHLDIAGTAMASPANEINTSWASGYGVRLLDRFVQDNYEN